MLNSRFAGSNGLMDVPAPSWIMNDESLFAHWGSFMLAMIKHGTVETIRRTDRLELRPTEFGLLIDGGLYATDLQDGEASRTLLISSCNAGIYSLPLSAAACTFNCFPTAKPHF